MTKQPGLGKGLSALINTDANNIQNSPYIENFDINKIKPNPYQPRMTIKPEDLVNIADSIREHGIIQPLIITRMEDDPDHYYIIAGERRFRAAQLAGLKKVPVVIKETSPQEMLELALIENIQRKDLNPLEEAEAFKQLHENFGLMHKDIATKVGLSRVAITNKIRLLSLPDKVKQMVIDEELSEGHARALLGISDTETLVAAAQIVLKRKLSVRETENLVRKITYDKKNPVTQTSPKRLLEMKWAEELSKKIGFTTQIRKTAKGGKVVIRFNSEKELQQLIDKLLGKTTS